MINSFIANWDILVVGVVVIATATLGFIVFFEDQRNKTHRQFLYFALLTAVWGILNYASYRIDRSLLAFVLLRFTIFSVTWQTLAFLLFTLAFPDRESSVPRFVRIALFAFTTCVSLLTLTPLVFKDIDMLSSTGRIISVINGPALPIFGMTTVGFSIAGVLIFFIKMWRSRVEQRVAYRPVALGLLGMFILIITSNFLLPVLWDNVDFIPFGALFVFPFIITTTFAIVRSNLFQVRMISAEGFVLLLLLLNLLQITQSQTASEFIVRGIIVLSILAISILLIRSVLREVKQRERLEQLTRELDAANAQLAQTNEKLEGMNEKLEKMDALKSEFVSMAGHQLRGPMTVIKGYISLILDGTIKGANAAVKDALKRAMFSTEQLIKLIASLLDLSRIEAGKIKYEMVEGDLARIISEVMDKFKEIGKKKGVTLTFENHTADAQVKFIFDRDKIREAVVNLVDNAIKYSFEGGRIAVALDTTGSGGDARARISVRDGGIGIKHEDIGKLFDKFSRTEEAKNHDPNGLGIGLYFAKRVVQDHGGRTGVESEGIGHGSTFWLELPINARGG